MAASSSQYKCRGFLKIGYFLGGVPIIRIIVCWGLYAALSILGYLPYNRNNSSNSNITNDNNY